MNEITAAIRKKAEEKYPDNPNECLGEYGDRMRDQICYTCGGEDAIGFMLKFTNWCAKYYDAHFAFLGGDVTAWTYKGLMDKEQYTTEQLLLKYMEDNKL